MFAASTPGQMLAKNIVYGTIGGLVVLTGVFAMRAAPTIALRRATRSPPRVHLLRPVLPAPARAPPRDVGAGWQFFEGRFLAIW